MDALIKKLGREPSQRSTLYGNVNKVQEVKSYSAMPLDDVVNNPVQKYSKKVKPQFFSISEQKVQQLAE